MFSPQQANAIYDKLVELCGASNGEWPRELFVSTLVRHDVESDLEYRFQGALGFGGKFYVNHRVYVTCYSEDLTDERQAMIRSMNDWLDSQDWKNG